MKYDFLIVGAGLFGSVCAHELRRAGKQCLVFEKHPHVAGHAYTESREGIQVHVYGAHIFHTRSERIWQYVTERVPFNAYVHRVKAMADGRAYTVPVSYATLREIYGIRTAAEAVEVLQRVRSGQTKAENMEDQALATVGPDVYRLLIEGYTAKQWGRHPRNLPASILKRFPLRRTFDDRFFGTCRYTGIPQNGYTELAGCLLEGAKVELGTAFPGESWRRFACRLIFTGSIDVYFNHSLGTLAYRSLRFKHLTKRCEQYQAAAVVNYCDENVSYTRVVEHKQFYPGLRTDRTVVTEEYPAAWQEGDERYYPISDESNKRLYRAYAKLARAESDVFFGGRLGAYRYWDMDQTIAAALELSSRLCR